jgi:hypothetical protein
MISSQEAETLARRCIELYNKRSLEWVDTCYAENVEWLELPLPSSPSGQHGNRTILRNAARRILSLFPDRQMTIYNLVARDNCVALELKWIGTAAATIGTFKMGSVIQYRVATFLTFSDRLITKQVDYCVQI